MVRKRVEPGGSMDADIAQLRTGISDIEQMISDFDNSQNEALIWAVNKVWRERRLRRGGHPTNVAKGISGVDVDRASYLRELEAAFIAEVGRTLSDANWLPTLREVEPELFPAGATGGSLLRSISRGRTKLRLEKPKGGKRQRRLT